MDKLSRSGWQACCDSDGKIRTITGEEKKVFDKCVFGIY